MVSAVMPFSGIIFPQNTIFSLFLFYISKTTCNANGLNPDQTRCHACSGLTLFAKAGSSEAKGMLRVNN